MVSSGLDGLRGRNERAEDHGGDGAKQRYGNKDLDQRKTRIAFKR
jgi:hypothetical protein